MAKLKSLKMKSREYVFTAYGNGGEERPAKIIFSRFPLADETFTAVDKKELFDGVDVSGLSKRELQAQISDKILNNFISNMYAGKTDYRLFFSECVDGFQDFEYEDSKIITAGDFWQILPQDAAYCIAQEAFEYAAERDEFTMGNLSA